ncbi:Protoheme IX farnesyltransferase, mitochondrial [Savitreella phatthalungensis]
MLARRLITRCVGIQTSALRGCLRITVRSVYHPQTAALTTNDRASKTVSPDSRRRGRPSISTLTELSKPRLTALVVLSTMASYAICPFAADAPLTTLSFLTAGTVLCSSSANAFNMWLEPPFDSQMSRTRNRPLVRGAVHPDQAFAIGAAAGVAGTVTLFMINPVCAGLGLANIVLYAGIYTPLKRVSILNTWAGAIVGAIPPLIGWFAASSHDPFSLDNIGALYLAGLLYAWQFPHFNSLAWYIRGEYARAGYVMASVTNPGINSRVSLRYAIACAPISWALVHADICHPWFLIDSSIVNGYLILQALRFWQASRPFHGDESFRDRAARKLFFASLLHLPLLLILAMIHKRSFWDESE